MVAATCEEICDWKVVCEYTSVSSFAANHKYIQQRQSSKCESKMSSNRALLAVEELL